MDIRDGDVIDLGERKLDIIEIGGHTRGSIMLFDPISGSLFSGDSVARRILYGLQDWTDMSDYLSALRKLQSYSIQKVYSMHDPYALDGGQPNRIIRNILEMVESASDIWTLPVTNRRFILMECGDPVSPEYFNMVFPEDRRKQVLEDLRKNNWLKAGIEGGKNE